MTLNPDNTGFGDYELMIDCDCENCQGRNEHVHLSRDSYQTDPRMSTRLNGWRLDVDGKDYAPNCPLPEPSDA